MVSAAMRRMGDRFRYLRIELGIHTTEELSELLYFHYRYRISSTTLARIETSDSRPGIDLLLYLCQLYEVDMNTLIDFPASNTDIRRGGKGKTRTAKIAHTKRPNR